ncbi:hypothetical protein BC826DRAFT_1113943 [Russula brevipes]|nr:hypothetical protein BC826DRAFT_1113943 [Russula brevipes]
MGLTPLISGPVSFPPPSPNTATFPNMMSSSTLGAMITPNTLNAITGVLTLGATIHGANTLQPHPLSISHLPPSSYEQWPQNYVDGAPAQTPDPQFTNSATNATSTAANGSFLLSQAHQELTKHEEALRARNKEEMMTVHPRVLLASEKGTLLNKSNKEALRSIKKHSAFCHFPDVSTS